MIACSDGVYKYTGTAMKIPVHNLIKQHLFSRSQLAVDFLQGKLVLIGYEESDYSEKIQLLGTDIFTGQVIWRDDLEKYLEMKNYEQVGNRAEVLLRAIHFLEKKVTAQEAIGKVIIAELVSIKSFLQKPSFVKLREVAGLFPQYSLGTLRNKLSASRWQDDRGVIHSELHINGFNLLFKKSGKEWISERFDFEAEKSKTYDYDFQRITGKGGA